MSHYVLVHIRESIYDILILDSSTLTLQHIYQAFLEESSTSTTGYSIDLKEGRADKETAIFIQSFIDALNLHLTREKFMTAAAHAASLFT